MSDALRKDLDLADAMIRLNHALPKKEWNRAWQVGPTKVTLSWRSKRNLWGRFGGGWNWALGVQWTTWRYVHFKLVVVSLSVSTPRSEAA